MDARWDSLTVILLVALLVRIALALVNRAANDNHVEVASQLIEYLAGTRSLSDIGCPECGKPKLYHLAIVGFMQLFHIVSPVGQVIAGQLLNVFAGLVTLITVKSFIERSDLQQHWRALSFALVALNPSLILINVQATNDSFAIAFGVMATYFLYLHLTRDGWLPLVAACGMMSLAALSKITCLALFPWAFLVLLVRITVAGVREVPRVRRSVYGLGLVVLAMLALLVPKPPFGIYRQYFHRVTITRAVRAVPPFPPPHLVERTYVGRPGVISVLDSYVTFRLLDLAKHPYISNGRAPVPFHRTSLWSQLYGRVHFAYFSQWVWTRTDELTLWLGRLLMIAGLIPTVILVCSFIASLAHCLRQLLTLDRGLAESADWIFPLQLAAFLTMLIHATYFDRGFDAMKDTYIFPSLLSGIAALFSGSRFLGRFRYATLKTVALLSCESLVTLYALNILLVLQQFFAPHLLPLH